MSLPLPPVNRSAPPKPVSVSTPPLPSSIFCPALPVMILFRAFPVPFIGLVPIRIKFLSLADRIVVFDVVRVVEASTNVATPAVLTVRVPVL